MSLPIRLTPAPHLPKPASRNDFEPIDPPALRMLEGISAVTGDSVFLTIARSIHETFGSRWAFVGELVTEGKVRTRAGWSDGASVEPFDYELAGTPCENVVWKGACAYPRGVQQLFPRDHLLVEMGAQSYFGVPVFGRSGAPLGILVALHDEPLEVQDFRGLLELAATRVAAEFEREHAERATRQNDRYESLALLAGGVAHDFNNLLTAILANLGLATLHLGSPRFDPDASREVRSLLADVDAAARAAAGLTRQLMAYSGRVTRARSVDLAPLVRETVKLVTPLLPPGAQVEVAAPTEMPAVCGDMTQLRQVVMNLVRNAGDALHGAGGRIDVRLSVVPPHAPQWRAADVRPDSFREDRAHVALVVADTGCGMSSEVRRQAFAPHFTTKSEGHGFGLAITANIVRHHGGAIAIETEPGKGTTMHVFLPVAENPAKAPARRAGPFAGARILVADDEPSVRAAMARALRRLGCEVTEVADGDAALRELRRTPRAVDCAILDLCMRGLGGDDVAMELHGEAPAIPIVLSSGLVSGALQEHLQSGAIAAALAKPWTNADLSAVLRAALPVDRDVRPLGEGGSRAGRLPF